MLEPYIVGPKNGPINHKEGKTIVGGNAQCYDAGDYNVQGISVSFKCRRHTEVLHTALRIAKPCAFCDRAG